MPVVLNGGNALAFSIGDKATFGDVYLRGCV